MKDTKPILLLVALVGSSGCDPKPVERKSDHASHVQPAPSDKQAESVVGAWLIAAGGESESARIELDAQGQWRLWASPSLAEPVKEPTQSGRWFVHEGMVYLRIDQSVSDKITPGMAVAFEVKSVTPQSITVTVGGHEMTCLRAGTQP